MMENSLGSTITIKVKSNLGEMSIEVNENEDIKKIREIVSEKFEYRGPMERLFLFFDGQIISSEATLQTYNIKNGMTIYIVIKPSSRLLCSNSTDSSNFQSDEPQETFEELQNLANESNLSEDDNFINNR